MQFLSSYQVLKILEILKFLGVVQLGFVSPPTKLLLWKKTLSSRRAIIMPGVNL